MKDIVILYHGNCPDGFGGAYSAWKKFGDSAEYIAVYHADPPPNLTDKEVYVVDFSYPEGKLLEIQKHNKRLVVLDHHEGAEESVREVTEHVFDKTRSGTGIAWEYFHPGEPLPRLLAYIQDNDLWKFERPHAKEVSAFVSSLKFEFEPFDPIVQKAETEEGFKDMVDKGRAYREYFEYVCDQIVATAQEIEFEGMRILATNSPRLFRSEVGHRLAKMKGPMAIVWYPHHGNWHFSLRGDGSIDLTKVAQKYGGNGHPNSASFQLPLGSPLPFTFVHSS
jgi:oligoribonuclease NrnB/cAMP/cGMP phosphodiesterase (DHH superfamily)